MPRLPPKAPGRAQLARCVVHNRRRLGADSPTLWVCVAQVSGYRRGTTGGMWSGAVVFGKYLSAQPSKCFCKAFESTEFVEALGKKRTLVALVSLMLVKCAAKHATLMACSLVGKH